MAAKKSKIPAKKPVKTGKVTASKKTAKTKKIVRPKKTANTKSRAKVKSAKKQRKEISKTTPAQSRKTTKAPMTKKGTTSNETALKTKTPKKNLTPREKKILDIRKDLMMQRRTLLSEAEEALNSLPDQTIFPDLGDQASAEIDRNFMLRLRGREQRLLKKIDAAIEKIDSNSFGTCEVCGLDIEIKRLEARPVTTMCIACKTEQEEEEKLRGE